MTHLDILHVGKYATFIGAAYGISVMVFAGMVWTTLAKARRWRKRAQALDAALTGR